jgi:hypothetical protein
MLENNIALASRVHAAWVAGEISEQRFVELCGDIVGKSFDSPAGRELTRPGRSPLTPEQNYRLAKQEYALAKLRKNPDGEEIVAKAATVEKSDAMLKLERLGKKYAEENQTDLYDGFSVICSTPEGARLLAEDKAERIGKDHSGREPYALSSDGDGHHDPDAELNDMADAHMAEHNKANPKKPITFEQAHVHVAQNDPRGAKLFRQSKMRAMAKNATA